MFHMRNPFMFAAKVRALIACTLWIVMLACMALPALATAEEIDAVSLVDAKAALLVEASTQQAIMGNGGDVLLNVAGLAKMPALLVVCEAVDNGLLDKAATVHVSRYAAGITGPTAFIEADETIKAGDLIKAAVIIGAGDAMVALGEHAFGTETAFVEQIHARLQALGIDVQLKNAVGQGAQFSAAMLAKIGAELMKSAAFMETSNIMLDSITHSDGRTTELASANRMLRNYAGCGGVMTGSSPEDGYCGVFSVARGDTQLIAVVAGCKNSSTRFAVATNMLDQAFAAKRVQKLATAGEVLAENVRVKGGEQKHINLVAKETVVLLLDKAEPSMQAVKDIPESIQAPVLTNQPVGFIIYQTESGEVKGRVELVAQSEVPAFSFRDLLSEVLWIYLRL